MPNQQQKATASGLQQPDLSPISLSKVEREKRSLRGMEYEDQQAALAPVGADPEAEKKKQQEAAKKQADFEAELKKQYERQFGGWLGGKLCDLLKDTLGPDALMKYAKQGVVEGLKELGKLAEKQGDLSPEMKQIFGPKAKEIADQLIGTPEMKGALTGLSNFVREHPVGLLTVALITAVLVGMKCYSDNIDIPELEGMFKVNDHLKLGGKIDLGHIQQLTIDSLHACMELHVSQFTMKLDAGHDVVKEDGKEDKKVFTVKGDAAIDLVKSEGKDVDPATQQLKREWANKLTATFGGVFEYNEADWSLEAMQLAAGLAFEARDKRLVDEQKIGELEKSTYRETILKLYANYLEKFKNVEGQLAPQELSLAMGLSLVMKKSVEIKTTDQSGAEKKTTLDPLQTSFNIGVTYNEKNAGLDPSSKNLGISTGVSIGQGNWSLGASVDYTRDLMKNQNNFGGKITFTIRW